MERSFWVQLEFKGLTLHCALLLFVFNDVWILLLVFIVGLTEDEPATQILTQNSLSESLEEIRVKLGQKQYLEAYYLLRNTEKQFPGAQELRYVCLNTVKSPSNIPGFNVCPHFMFNISDPSSKNSLSMHLQFKIFLNVVFMSAGLQMFSRSFTVLLLVLFTLLLIS
jgi:hypothetical protein